MQIVVTGAAGFVGSHLAQRLAGLGHTVIGIDCFTDYYARALKTLNAESVRHSGVRLLELDLAADDLTDAVREVEIVYHLAAQPGISRQVPFETYVRNNLIATHRLVEAVKGLASLRCFVNASTSSVYGYYATSREDAEPKPASYYGVTKLAAEQLVLAHWREQTLPACSFRLFSIYGERERPDKIFPRLIRCALSGEAFPLYAGSENHSRSFTYVGDAVDGLVAALSRIDRCLGKIVNLGSDHEVPVREAIRTVEAIAGRAIQTVSRPRRSGDQLHTRADITLARELLDYAPRTSLPEGIRAEVEWFQMEVVKRLGLDLNASSIRAL